MLYLRMEIKIFKDKYDLHFGTIIQNCFYDSPFVEIDMRIN